MRLVGHSDQGGRPDGVQVMVHRGHAYVGHMFSKGFSVIDVRDPKNPRAVNYLAAPPEHLEHPSADARRSAAGHQRQGHVRRRRVRRREGLLQRRSSARWSAPPKQAGERATGPRDSPSMTSPSRRSRAASASCRSRAAASIASGTPADAGPTPRSLLDGFTDYIFITIDMSDPAKPREAGRWWIPGMNQAAGETPSWPATQPLRSAPRHHPRRHRLRRLARRRHGGDRRRRPRQTEADRAPRTARRRSAAARTIACRCRTAICWSCSTKPCSITRRTASSLSGCSTTAWQTNPVSIATFPQPTEADYKSKGGHFGPHNIHENRPGTLRQLAS